MDIKRQGETTEEMIKQYKEQLKKEKSGKTRVKMSFSKIFKKISFLLSIVLIFILVFIQFNIILSKKSGEIPNVFGYYIFEVETESMVPTLPVGTKILSKSPSENSAIEVGTIVTFKDTEGRVITHRIIEVVQENGKTGYRTKGDNPINDPDNEILEPDRVIATFIRKL